MLERGRGRGREGVGKGSPQLQKMALWDGEFKLTMPGGCKSWAWARATQCRPGFVYPQAVKDRQKQKKKGLRMTLKNDFTSDH